MNIETGSYKPLYWCPLERRLTKAPHEGCELEHRARLRHRENMKAAKKAARYRFYAALSKMEGGF